MFEIVTVLNVSYLFVPLVYFAGISSSIFSAASLLLYSFYIFQNQRIIGNRTTSVFFISILIAPLVVTIILSAASGAPFSVRAIGERVLLVSLAFASSSYYLSVSVERIRHLLMLLILMSMSSVGYSMLSPEFFYGVAEQLNAQSVHSGRGFGFFLQPNSAALALNVLVFGYLCVSRNSFGWPLWIALSGVLMTASRSGLASLLAMLIVYFLQNSGLSRGALSLRTVRFGLVSVAAAALIGGVTFQFVRSFSGGEGFSALERLEALAMIESSANVAVDADVRTEIATYYWQQVLNSPFGHGLGSVGRLVESGSFSHSTHNQFLDVGYQTGWLGLVLYLGFLIVVSRNLVANNGMKVGGSLLTLLVTQSFFISAVLTSRTVFFVLGISFALRKLPRFDRLGRGRP